jgi:hypothetical protein
MRNRGLRPAQGAEHRAKKGKRCVVCGIGACGLLRAQSTGQKKVRGVWYAECGMRYAVCGMRRRAQGAGL